MSSLDFDIGLACNTGDWDDQLAEAAEEFCASGARVTVECRASQGYAGLEWLLPTAVIVFIANKYVGAMLEEAGKNHYQVFSKALRKLLDRTNRLPLLRAGTPGKLSDDPPGALSAYLVIEEGVVLKFVFDSDLATEDQDAALRSLLELLHSFNNEPEHNLRELSAAMGWRRVFRFDLDAGAWRVWDGQKEKYVAEFE